MNLEEIERRANVTPIKMTPIEKGETDCPVCDGEGFIDFESYDGPDTWAGGVEVFGIGDHLEKQKDFVLNARKDVLDLVAEVKRLRAEIQRDKSGRELIVNRAKGCLNSGGGYFTLYAGDILELFGEPLE